MSDPSDQLPSRTGLILLLLVALAAVGFFLLLNSMNRKYDPLYPDPLLESRQRPPAWQAPTHSEPATDESPQTQPATTRAATGAAVP
jgi:hypothetical protein